MTIAAAGLVLLGWACIIRLGLVQSALGSIVVLTPSTLNRVMVVELALPAMRGIEGRAGATPISPVSLETAATKPTFREAFAEVWSERDARRFTTFVCISMLAYGAQDLILEPFAGSVYGFTPGESTELSGLQHAGVLAGASDLARSLSGSTAFGYEAMGAGAAVLFIVSAVIAFTIGRFPRDRVNWPSVSVLAVGAQQMSGVQQRM